MDRALANKIGKELEEAAIKIAKKYPGVTAVAKGGRFDSTTFGKKIEFRMKDASGRTREEAAWDLHAESYGLDVTLLGTTVRGKKIVGLDLKKHKYPVILIDEKTGKSYKAPVSSFAGVL